MRRPRPNRSLVYALYANAALLLAILIALLCKGGGVAFAASQTPPIAGGAGIFLMPAQFSTNTWGCYIMDVDTQTLCSYQFFPGEKQLKLVAARDFHFDRNLRRFNTSPDPSEIQKLNELERNAARGAERRRPGTRRETPARKHDLPGVAPMMAKMFYTLDEAKTALGKSEDEIKQYAREGRLREFRDGPRLMFKADQVEQLKSELAAAAGDQVDLGVSDSGGLIGLVDTTGASGTSITLSDPTSAKAPRGRHEAEGRHRPGRRPGPVRLHGRRSLARGRGRPLSGTGLSGTASGSRAASTSSAATSIEHVDPSAQTAITGGIREQINLEGVGSGSGLLDLTRESDDTSLGAVLDEITPDRPPVRQPHRPAKRAWSWTSRRRRAARVAAPGSSRRPTRWPPPSAPLALGGGARAASSGSSC